MQVDFAIKVCDRQCEEFDCKLTKKKKKKGDDNPIRLFYCNNIIHTYIIFIYRWRWVLPTMPT